MVKTLILTKCLNLTRYFNDKWFVLCIGRYKVSSPRGLLSGIEIHVSQDYEIDIWVRFFGKKQYLGR